MTQDAARLRLQNNWWRGRGTSAPYATINATLATLAVSCHEHYVDFVHLNDGELQLNNDMHVPSPPPISATASLHISISPQHRRSRFSDSILRLFFPALKIQILIIRHSELRVHILLQT